MEVHPKAFISYAWQPQTQKAWARELAAQLRGDGVDVTLDQWATAPGDQLPQFMERAIREHDLILVVCTPEYKVKSDGRTGGVGYEGDIMTAELLRGRELKRFIPILAAGDFGSAVPTWLGGRYAVDLRGSTYSEEQYHDLLNTLLGTRQPAPPVGKARARPAAAATQQTAAEGDAPAFEPIRLLGVAVDQVGSPRNDGSAGSALYAVPFMLSRRAPENWGRIFVHTWNNPPRFTTMHRPGIARVSGDRVVLDGTTLDEVRDVHRDTLKRVMDVTNRIYGEAVAKQAAAERAAQLQDAEHRRQVQDIAQQIKFD
jgi:hypothetical protein